MKIAHAVLFGRTYLLFDVGGVVAAVCLALTALASAIGNTRALYAAEPLPRERAVPAESVSGGVRPLPGV